VSIFPLEKRQDVAMETAAKIMGVSTERNSLKTPEQQRDIFTNIVETYTSQSIGAVVKQNGSYSSSAVNHGLGLAGLAAIHDPELGLLTAGKKLLQKALGPPTSIVRSGQHIEQVCRARRKAVKDKELVSSAARNAATDTDTDTFSDPRAHSRFYRNNLKHANQRLHYNKTDSNTDAISLLSDSPIDVEKKDTGASFWED
jgi:hypothetical protein